MSPARPHTGPAGRSCAACGRPLAPTAKFCAHCGTPVALQAARGEQRRRAGARASAARATRAIAVLFCGVLGAVALLANTDLVGLPLVAVWSAVQVTIGIVALTALDPQSRRSSLPLRVTPASSATAVFVGTATFAASLAYVWLLVTLLAGGFEPLADADRPDVAEILLVILVAPVCEEWLCRGVLWSVLAPFTGAWPRTTASAVLFGLLHCLEGLAGFPHRFVAGMAFGGLRQRYGSLAPAIVAHATHNILCVAWGAV